MTIHRSTRHRDLLVFIPDGRVSPTMINARIERANQTLTHIDSQYRVVYEARNETHAIDIVPAYNPHRSVESTLISGTPRKCLEALHVYLLESYIVHLELQAMRQ